MGFTISNYSLFGLQPQNFYASILGSYSIKKNHPVIGHYTITYVVYYSSSKGQEVITKLDAYFSIEQLPTPADIYITIYANIKASLGDVQIVDD
jgi:hypothetical protein